MLYYQLHKWDLDESIREIHVVFEPTASEDWSAVADRISRAAREIK